MRFYFGYIISADALWPVSDPRPLQCHQIPSLSHLAATSALAMLPSPPASLERFFRPLVEHSTSSGSIAFETTLDLRLDQPYPLERDADTTPSVTAQATTFPWIESQYPTYMVSPHDGIATSLSSPFKSSWHLSRPLPTDISDDYQRCIPLPSV